MLSFKLALTARCRRAALCVISLLLTAGALRSLPGLELSPPPVAMQAGCQGRCVDPHPANFNTWNEPAGGCRVKVWRQWPDGCLHYQWYDSCSGVWDNNPDGTPKVNWTCCVH